MNVWIFWSQWEKASYFWIRIEGCEKTYQQREKTARTSTGLSRLFSAGLKRFGTIPLCESTSGDFLSPPLNKDENYYRENHSGWVPHARARLPRTHVNTSRVKLSADGQRVRTAEWEASTRARRRQTQEDTRTTKDPFTIELCLLVRDLARHERSWNMRQMQHKNPTNEIRNGRVQVWPSVLNTTIKQK